MTSSSSAQLGQTGSRHQRGSASLVVVLGLLAALALALLYANRSLLMEQKAAANQVRAARAFDAAEAGLDWAWAMLNQTATVDENCAAAAGGTSWRDRMLRRDGSTGRFVPATRRVDGRDEVLATNCVTTAAGWTCRCPVTGSQPAMPLSDAGTSDDRPAFSVRFGATPRPGTVQLLVTGCAPADACDANDGASGHAVARLQVTLALLPAVATPPVAALTVRGDVSVDGTLGLYATDPRTSGLTVHAGGTVLTPRAVRVSVPGTPTALSVVERDATVSGQEPARFFVGVFGLDKARWRRQPGVHALTCPGACDAEFASVLAGGADAPTRFWIGGDLQLASPLILGTPERPVVLVVDGQLRLVGGAVVHGLVYTTATRWDTSTSTGGTVRGALVAEGDVVGQGALDVVHDAAVLARLHEQAGSFARLPGSWRDF